MQKIIVALYIACLLSKSAQQYPPYYQNQPNDYTDLDKGYDDYDDSRECLCSCQHCEEIKPCCRNTCIECFPSSSIVLVPYPYPVIISTNQKDTTTAITTERVPFSPHTSTESPPTPTTTELPITEILRNNEAYINDIIARAPHMSKKNKFVLTNLRRTRADYTPKYGIVPIPDNLAEKLMLQLRSMRVLHPKETFNASPTLSSLEKIVRFGR